MRSKLIVVAVLSITVFSRIAHAETTTEESEKEKQSTSQIEKESTKKPKKNKGLKEFTPSEEISIDKPVAFPVDI